MAIYTPRGDCGSVRVAARMVGGRVYSEDHSYQASGVVSANGAVRVSVTGAGRSASGWGDYRAIPARDDGGRREEKMFWHLVSLATRRVLLRGSER